MYSIRKWMFKPKKPDESLLAEFFYADDDLNQIAAELDSFDGRKDPERCTSLVNQLRHCQDKVLVVVEKIIQHVLPQGRATRDFRVKFPDDVLQDNLAGQLWFGAECLSAGSSIMNREVESASMRPLAKALTKQLDVLRSLLRDQCLKDQNHYNDKIMEALEMFDCLFAEFELSYVSAMVPVKTMKEYDMLQEVTVLFCETVQRALKLELLSQDMLDAYDPALMFTIPRLAIICGLLVYPEGPINPDMDPMNMSEMFRPFQMLLYKIRELLCTLSRNELWLLEKALSSSEDNTQLKTLEEQLNQLNRLDQLNELAPHGNPFHQGSHDNMNNEVSGYVSHSPSTLTVTEAIRGSLDTSNGDDVPEELDGQVSVHQERSFVPHQDSRDSGMLSMSENLASSPAKEVVTTTRRCHASRLRKSQSWPPPAPSTSSHSRCQRHSICGDSREYLCSLELLQCCHLEDSVQQVMNTQSMPGSREFQFHLPRNTSRQNSQPEQMIAQHELVGEECSLDMDPDQRLINPVPADSDTEIAGKLPVESQNSAQLECCSTAIEGCSQSAPGRQQASPQIHSATNNHSLEVYSNGLEQDDLDSSLDDDTSVEDIRSVDQSSPAIMYTDNGMETQTLTMDMADSGDDQPTTQIAFITSALNDFFFTDPGFQGVAPPRSSVPCNNATKSRKYSKSHRNANGTKRSVPANQCPMCNSDQGHESVKGQNSNQVQGHNSRQVEGEVNISVSSANCDRSVKTNSQDSNKLCSRHSKLEENNQSGVPGREKLHSNHSSYHEFDWDRESYVSSDSSSYTSDTNDDEEIALAIQAAEITARQEARARYRNSSDLIHKLFVCVSGVADQLQTNYASDLRHILKLVFQSCCYEADDISEPIHPKPHTDVSMEVNVSPQQPASDTELQSNHSNQDDSDRNHVDHITPDDATPVPSPNRRQPQNTDSPGYCPPLWIPDDESLYCMSCKVPFTFVRRRHHCRNCGKLFCGRCSCNTVPLPHYGHDKPVRVCNNCFIYQVTPFTVTE